jgi:hypothetical protein
VTIPDAIVIVDSGKVKELHYDPGRRMSELGTHYASTASATQRRGRAGRVAPGECYRIYSKAFFEGGGMLDRPIPEIQRMELQHTCLQTKALLPDRLVHSVLSRAMDPPAAANVEVALRRLEDLGAILTANSDDASGKQGSTGGGEALEVMTTLGRRLSTLPVEPAVGKMLLTGALFKCLDPAVTAAACSGSRSPFVSSPMLREQSQLAQKRFGPDSDLEAASRAFQEWQRVKEERGFRAAGDWAWDNSLVLSALTGIDSTRQQLLKALSQDARRFAPGSSGARAQDQALAWGVPGSLNERAGDVLLQRALFAMSLPANLARHRVCSSTGYRTSLEPAVAVHPGSVNCEVARGKRVVDPSTGKPAPGPDWLVYKEMVASSSNTEPFLRGTAAVDPAALLLFCGTRLEARVHGGGSPASGDAGWLDDEFPTDGLFGGAEPAGQVAAAPGGLGQGARLSMGQLDDWVLCVAQDRWGASLETDLEALSLLRAELHGVALPTHLRQSKDLRSSDRGGDRGGDQRSEAPAQGNGQVWVSGQGRQAQGSEGEAEARAARAESVVAACVRALHAGSAAQQQMAFRQRQPRAAQGFGAWPMDDVDPYTDDFFNDGPVNEAPSPFKSSFFSSLLNTK